MPERHSTPARPSRHAAGRRARPTARRPRPRGDPAPSRAPMPRVAIRSTVPGKPSSATTTFDPAREDEQGLAGVVGAVTAAIDGVLVRGLDQAAGGAAEAQRRQVAQGASGWGSARPSEGTARTAGSRAVESKTGPDAPPAAAVAPARPRRRGGVHRRARRLRRRLAVAARLLARGGRDVTVTGVSGPEAPRCARRSPMPRAT